MAPRQVPATVRPVCAVRSRPAARLRRAACAARAPGSPGHGGPDTHLINPARRSPGSMRHAAAAGMHAPRPARPACAGSWFCGARGRLRGAALAKVARRGRRPHQNAGRRAPCRLRRGIREPCCRMRPKSQTLRYPSTLLGEPHLEVDRIEHDNSNLIYGEQSDGGDEWRFYRPVEGAGLVILEPYLSALPSKDQIYRVQSIVVVRLNILITLWMIR